MSHPALIADLRQWLKNLEVGETPNNERIEVSIEDPWVGRSFECFLVRARYMRFIDDEPTSAVLISIPQNVLVSDLPSSSTVGRAVLTVLRNRPVNFRAHEPAPEFSIRGLLWECDIEYGQHEIVEDAGPAV